MLHNVGNEATASFTFTAGILFW